MNRKWRPTKSRYQIKEEQVNFLLQDIEKNPEEYKKAVELRDNQLAETKKILKGAKNIYDLLVKENKQLKEYILNIKQKFKQYQQQQQQQQQQFLQGKEYFQRPQKIFKNSLRRRNWQWTWNRRRLIHNWRRICWARGTKKKNKNNLKTKDKIKYLII